MDAADKMGPVIETHVSDAVKLHPWERPLAKAQELRGGYSQLLADITVSLLVLRKIVCLCNN